MYELPEDWVGELINDTIGHQTAVSNRVHVNLYRQSVSESRGEKGNVSLTHSWERLKIICQTIFSDFALAFTPVQDSRRQAMEGQSQSVHLPEPRLKIAPYQRSILVGYVDKIRRVR
jgi:hypothetical protein